MLGWVLGGSQDCPN